MFKKKYKISLIDNNWRPLKRDIEMSVLPKVDEFIYHGEDYYKVFNLVHDLRNGQEVLIICDKIGGKIISNLPNPQPLRD